jgi:hypothetical protein
MALSKQEIDQLLAPTIEGVYRFHPPGVAKRTTYRLYTKEGEWHRGLDLGLSGDPEYCMIHAFERPTGANSFARTDVENGYGMILVRNMDGSDPTLEYSQTQLDLF